MTPKFGVPNNKSAPTLLLGTMRLALACLLVPVVCGLNTASEGGVPVLRRVARQPAIRILAGLDLLEEGKKPRRVTKPEKRAPAKSDGSSAAVMAVGALLTLLGATAWPRPSTFRGRWS